MEHGGGKVGQAGNMVNGERKREEGYYNNRPDGGGSGTIGAGRGE